MTTSKKIIVSGKQVSIILGKDENDFISLTDMAKFKAYDSGVVISNWLTTKYTVQFMGAWEQIHNPNFNVMEFHNIKNEAGSNGFILSSSKWIQKTNSIGIKSSVGRYVGVTPVVFAFLGIIMPILKINNSKTYFNLLYR